jgi:hypothetical protein
MASLERRTTKRGANDAPYTLDKDDGTDGGPRGLLSPRPLFLPKDQRRSVNDEAHHSPMLGIALPMNPQATLAVAKKDTIPPLSAAVSRRDHRQLSCHHGRASATFVALAGRTLQWINALLFPNLARAHPNGRPQSPCDDPRLRTAITDHIGRALCSGALGPLVVPS